ncbi:uncharacterized protein BDW47DRAFT_102856 [Aspergillus candidus]|uniref:Uncharacterized protein n=1 Tax=Aspergillus candidus TaxID=41067 RepID=A0A2I2FGA1_ASPCN|nr:hypothetical protein BDW47DRAFT_102856 [Aspergillus candidus]PLB39650.1 hypothetical protein BDW47DRAFT_102856 [Aspergillus candidus]
MDGSWVMGMGRSILYISGAAASDCGGLILRLYRERDRAVCYLVCIWAFRAVQSGSINVFVIS